MMYIVAKLFLNVNPFNAKLTVCLNGSWFTIASTVGEYSLWQMLVRAVADGTTNLLGSALYDHHNCRLDSAFYGIWAEISPNMR